MEESTAERMTKLESQLAHLDHQYDQLNQVVIEQGKRLARLESEWRRVASSVDGLELERIRSTNAKPPHYQ